MASMDDRRDAAALKRIQTDDGWEVVLKKLAKRIDAIARTAVDTGGRNEFEELKALHQAQGGITELTRFFDDLEKNAFDDE